jgi:hypothetical protein
MLAMILAIHDVWYYYAGQEHGRHCSLAQSVMVPVNL